MTPRNLESMTATIHFENKDAAMLDEFGVSVLGVDIIAPGPRLLTYPEAVDIVDRMKRAMPGIPKRLMPRFRATMNGIRTAFGPEFWELH
jgi:hypothetical protein